jgi:hypothetical protein
MPNQRWDPSWQVIEQAPGTDCCGAPEGERCRYASGIARGPHAKRRDLAIALGYYKPGAKPEPERAT